MAPSLTTTVEEYAINHYELTLKPVSTEHGVRGKELGRRLINEALAEHVASIDQETCEAGEEDTFFVADIGEVYRQHLRWKRNLPRVKPHYAVKCNPDPEVLRLLAALGTGFDCASKAEIETVLKLGVDPARIIFAQPCKASSSIRYSSSVGVRQMTFDNADELYKIKRHFPDAELLLRILTDDSASLCRLSLKFGAGMDTTQDLLALAKELGLNVTGVAFHAGSGASDPEAFRGAVRDARTVFDQAEALGYHMTTLDVGGGFVPGTFEVMAAALSQAIDDNFPPHVRVIGEPGRYYVSQAFVIACHVIARRAVEIANGENSYMLYLNDGVYGNFSSIMFDHQHPIPQVLKAGGIVHRLGSRGLIDDSVSQGPIYSIWGPTCDGIDCISESATLQVPGKPGAVVDIGDWLAFEEMGAYTKCSATRFNGFSNEHIVRYVCSEPGAAAALEACR